MIILDSYEKGAEGMTNYCGYMGKVMLLDLTTMHAEEYPWTDRDRELYLGG